MKLSALILLIVVLLLPTFAVGQILNPNQPQMKEEEADETPITNVRYGRNKLGRLTEKDRLAIGINSNDVAKFATFLKQPDTGMVRLHDISLCTENMRVLDANAPCPQNVLGKGASFSFRLEDYRTISFSDIRYDAKKLEIVGINVLGFLSNLGDVSLETVDLKTAGIKELAEFEPSTDYQEIIKQQRFARKGFQVGDFIYRSFLPAQLNKTYILRLIAYQGDFYFQIGKMKKYLADLDKRKDLVIAFRLIRQYDDGSIGLVWKELQRKDAPYLTEK